METPLNKSKATGTDCKECGKPWGECEGHAATSDWEKAAYQRGLDMGHKNNAFRESLWFAHRDRLEAEIDALQKYVSKIDVLDHVRQHLDTLEEDSKGPGVVSRELIRFSVKQAQSIVRAACNGTGKATACSGCLADARMGAHEMRVAHTCGKATACPRCNGRGTEADESAVCKLCNGLGEVNVTPEPEPEPDHGHGKREGDR